MAECYDSSTGYLFNKNGVYYLRSEPVKELNIIDEKATRLRDLITNDFDITQRTGSIEGPGELRITMDQMNDYSIAISNRQNEKVVIGYEKSGNRFFIDRTHSGKIDFNPKFPGVFYAPRISDKNSTDIKIIIDRASVELFADGGLTVMTAIFFPTEAFTSLSSNLREK